MIAVLCLGLSGISVGLGARLPNLRETDPSKIAAGFGGTLNLLVSLVFIFAIVTALALPCHLYFAQPTRHVCNSWSFPTRTSAHKSLTSRARQLAHRRNRHIRAPAVGLKAFQKMEF